MKFLETAVTVFAWMLLAALVWWLLGPLVMLVLRAVL